MKQLFTPLLAVISLLVAACSSSGTQAPRAIMDGSVPTASVGKPLTILISIDGFRADYLERGATPVLLGMANAGVSGAMQPSFPSMTFPNHYTLVTGKRPDLSGMINNRMEDPNMPGETFTLGNRTVASNPAWWADGTPIWVSAERAGVKTGTMFWPGSDFELEGVRPTKWRDFDQTLMDFARVDLLLSWLDAPEDERPEFMTLYFDIVDTAGHRYGPESLETTAAAAQVDAAISRLRAGLAARGLLAGANLVVVADHGMTEVSPERTIDLDAMGTDEVLRVIWDGPFVGIEPVEGHETEAEAALLLAHEHGTCWAKGNLPARFGYGTHERVPAYICLADLGWAYASSQIPKYPNPAKGNHGFDPAEPDMASLFIASGPAFRSGVVVEPFENVSIYPLLMRLVGIDPEPGTADLDELAAALN